MDMYNDLFRYSSLARAGVKSKVDQNSRLSKARPSVSALLGSARTAVSTISSSTHCRNRWKDILNPQKAVQPTFACGPIGNLPRFSSPPSPQAATRSHMSYLKRDKQVLAMCFQSRTFYHQLRASVSRLPGQTYHGRQE